MEKLISSQVAYNMSSLSAMALFMGNGRRPSAGIKVGRNLIVGSRRTIYNDGSNTQESITSPQYELILNEIHTQKGTLKKSLSSSDTTPRAYYVWRMARFHGGRDMTMPMMATCLCNNRSEGASNMVVLDALADKIAEKSFGSSLQAAHTWCRALGL